MPAGPRAMDSSWRSWSYILLAPASWLRSTGDCRAQSCWLKHLRRTQLEIEELYPAGSSVFAALNWRSRSSILLAQASMDCTQLEIEELYPAGSSVFAALNWRSRSSILLAQTSMDCTQLEIKELYPAGSNVNGLHSTGDCGAQLAGSSPRSICGSSVKR